MAVSVMPFLTILVGLLFVACRPIQGGRPVRGVDSSDNEANILILGAGASGLQAARTFHDAGMDDFIIIEAADRKGGRIYNTQFAGQNVEVGAGWSYSEVRPQTYKLVQDLDLDRRASNYESVTFRNDTGHNITDQGLADYDKLEPAVEKLLSLRDRMRKNNAIPDMSQRSALRLGNWRPESATEKVIEWFEYDFEYAESVEVTSTKESEGFGETFFLKDQGGFKQIFDVVAGFLNEPEYINHTRLNQKVVSIDYSDDVSVVVTCEDGTKYVGEDVLITFSIGVLQNDLVQFIPPLPEWKDVVIKKFLMAGYTHIYLSFPSKFWDDTEWILHASERRGYYPAFLNLQADGFYPDGTPMLLATVTGEESRRVDAQSSTRTKAEIEQVLRSIYGDDVPDATDILVSGWTQNPLTRGSYSVWPVEVSTQCVHALQSRVRRVFFGGEATSLLHYSYVEGGLDSGNREALKILGCMENFKDCPAFEGYGLGCETQVITSASTVHDGSSLLMGILTGYLLYGRARDI